MCMCTLGRRPADEPPIALAIALARAADDFGRERRCRRLFVPAALYEEVAHVLLVEGRGRDPGVIDLGVPVPRGAGGEDLIDNEELAVVETELEFCVPEGE